MHRRVTRPVSNPGAKRWVIACATLLIAGSAAAQPAPSQQQPVGEWWVEQHLARIKIADCDGQLWGVVSWESKPGVDRNNPDEQQRIRPTLGMPILLGMKRTKPNQWSGEIYNSEDGHTYSAYISMTDPNTLRVEGCFLGFLCGGQNWARYELSDTPPVTTPGQRRPSPQRQQPGARRPAAGPPPIDVCSSIPGAPGAPHERGLK
jgi:uncharacterized protein (DUF2147 family)